MKGIKLLIAILFLGTVFSQNAETANAATKTQTLYVTADKLNVREKPSTKSKSVGSLKLGTKLKVYSQAKNGWSKIDYKKKKAYVFSKYIKKAPKNQFSRIKFFAKQGQVEPALPLVVNDKASTLVNILGKPSSEYNSGLGFFMEYTKKDVNFLIINSQRNENPESYKDLSKKAYIRAMEVASFKRDKSTYKDLKSALGKPDGVGENDNHSYLVAYYDLGKCFVSFLFPKKDYKDEKISDNDQLIQYRVILK